MKIRLISLLVLGALLHGHAHALPQAQQIGKYYTQNIDGIKRGYKVYTPKGYDPVNTWKYEVVFLLHGDFTSPDFLADTMSHFIAKADAEKFILVLPQAMYNTNGDALVPTANDMDPNNPGSGLFVSNDSRGVSWCLKDDNLVYHELRYLDALRTQVSNDFKVDPERFYLVGHSRGAILTQYAAMRLNQAFAAFASIAGQAPKELVQAKNNTKITLASWTPSFRVPILIMNGTEDPKLPYLHPYDERHYNVQSTVGCWLLVNKSNGGSVFSKIDTVDEAANLNDDGENLWVENLNFCNGDVNFYAIMGGGHHWHRLNGFSWLGDLPSATLCEDIDTTDIVWNFFKNRRKSDNGTIPKPIL